MSRKVYLDGPSEVGLGKAQPEQAGYGHAHTEPREEAEEIDDGEDVLGDGVHHGQTTLRRDENKARAYSLSRRHNISVL